jgi:hypothetical protein
MSTIEFVRDSLAPTALLTAEHDAVVPKRRSEPLREATRNLMFERVIAAGHNNICDRPAFAVAMHEALPRIEAVWKSDHAAPLIKSNATRFGISASMT